MDIGFEVRTLDVDRVGGVDYRVGYVVDNSAARDAVLIVGLNADVMVSRGFVRYYCCVVDVDDSCCAFYCLGCNCCYGRVFGRLVVLYNKTIIDVHFAAVNADSFVLAVANDEVLDSDFRAECVDTIIVHVGRHAMN